MTHFRTALPQMKNTMFLTDGGIETTLIFHDKLDLPYFAAFDLLRTDVGRAVLRHYYARYIQIASALQMGFILESPTWRASADWGAKLGYDDAMLDSINRASITLMSELRDTYQSSSPMVVSGCVGPRGDGYDPGQLMTASEAEVYHATQIRSFDVAGADMISAITMTNVEEALGITRAAKAANIPVAISFTVETDGCLPTGQTLGDAITEVDLATNKAPAYYMINCAHPSHFGDTLAGNKHWQKRIKGLRANASCRSHAELNEAPDLDDGNPIELGQQYRALIKQNPQINVLGGCCGTDHRHIHSIGLMCQAA